MTPSLLVLYGSYRSDRAGIRLARFLVTGFAARGARVELVDARDIFAFGGGIHCITQQQPRV